MPALNTVYPPEIWARESLMLTKQSMVAANLVHTDFKNEVAQHGDVVTTRKRDKFSIGTLANTITSSMNVVAATATNVSVTLDTHNVVAFAITGRDQDTSIKNLVEEFMEPAIIPLAEAVDNDLLDKANGGLCSTAHVVTANATLDLSDFAGVRQQLRTNQVPLTSPGGTPRVNLVLGVEHEASALVIPELITANQSGVSTPATATGYINTIYGMGVYADQGVPTGTTAGHGQSVAFHRDAMTLITRPLEQVGSDFGIRSSVVSADGVSLRVMQSFQHVNARWLVSLDMLYGKKMLNGDLAVLLSDG